jgi:hypothetical protein
MPVIELVVDQPLPRWQADCAARLAAEPEVAVRLRHLASTGGRLWRGMARRSAQLRPTVPPRLAGSAEPGDLVIDLTGRRGAIEPCWKLLRGDGRPLSTPFPYADVWCRPGGLAVVLLVDQAGRVVRSVHLSSQERGYRRLVDDVLRFAALMPVLGWRDLCAGAAGPELPAPALHGGGGSPLGLLVGGVRYLGQRLVGGFSVDQWRVGLADQPIHAFLDPRNRPRIDWLTRIEPTAYCADPIARPDDPDEIWWERYDYATHHGVLQRMRRGSGLPPETVEMDVDCHQSFPGMVQIDGEVLLLPEMSQSGTTRLYRLRADGTRECLAILPVPGIDPILFRWQDRLWLGLTRADLDTRSNFCLWHAPALSGPWTEHRGNPVKVDVRSARCAGPPFRHDGQLYRPAQDCAMGYGRRVVINRVLSCSPTEFREEVVAVVAPRPEWSTHDGLHTLAPCGERTLIDAERTVFSFPGLGAKLGRRWRARATRRPAPSHTTPAHPR